MLAVHSEDIDLSWRMWLGGQRTVLAHSAKVYHRNKTLAERKMMNTSEYRILFSLEKNALRMMLKNLSLRKALASVPIAVLVAIGQAVMAFVRTGSSVRARAAAKAFVWNFRVLEDTMKERRKVQESVRRVRDAWVFQRIMHERSFIRHVMEYLLTKQTGR